MNEKKRKPPQIHDKPKGGRGSETLIAKKKKEKKLEHRYNLRQYKKTAIVKGPNRLKQRKKS